MKIIARPWQMLLLLLTVAVIDELRAQSPNNPLPQWVYDSGRARDEFERMQRTNPNQLPRERKRVSSISRKERERVMEEEQRRIQALKAPAPEDLDTYRDFLAQKGTGIFKLFDFSACRGRTVDAESGCADYFPNAGTYSFRPEATTADLVLQLGLFAPNGFFSRYIISDIGDLDLGSLTLGSRYLKFVEDFAPATTITEARSQYRELLLGVHADGHRLGIFAQPRLNGTYALRVIAYRCGNNLTKAPKPDKTPGTVDYVQGLSHISKDKRIDMTVAFKVIRIENSGMTIIWKEIARKDSPVLIFTKDDKWGDLR